MRGASFPAVFPGIGVIGGRNVSLVVTEESGLYKNVTDVWSSFNGTCATKRYPSPLNSSMNGKFYDFGKINLQSVQDKSASVACPGAEKPMTGKGKFKMCLVDSADHSLPMTGEQFV